MAIEYVPVSRAVGQFAAVQAAAREHYYKPRRSSRPLGQELLLPPPLVVPLVLIWHEGEHHWHPVANHHDLVQLRTEGAVVVLVLWVLIVWAHTQICVASTRRFPDTRRQRSSGDAETPPPSRPSGSRR